MSDTTTKTTKLITFLDTIGRTILGEVTTSNDETELGVKNAVILQVVQTDQSGRMSVQLLPIFFREFLSDKTGDYVFYFKKNNITTSDIDTLDFRLQAQYEQMFNKNNAFVSPQPQQPDNSQSVINLFDE
jgi:hypothetical protein